VYLTTHFNTVKTLLRSVLQHFTASVSEKLDISEQGLQNIFKLFFKKESQYEQLEH